MPRHVSGVLDNLMGRWEKQVVKKGEAVTAAWQASTSTEIVKHARPVSFKNGILMVIVENSSWLYRLTMEKRKIKERFNNNYSGRKKASDIRFRVGMIE